LRPDAHSGHAPARNHDLINKAIAKVFGTKNEREIKRLMPRVAAISALESEMQSFRMNNFAPKPRSSARAFKNA